jgi:hypothetical protein
LGFVNFPAKNGTAGCIHTAGIRKGAYGPVGEKQRIANPDREYRIAPECHEIIIRASVKRDAGCTDILVILSHQDVDPEKK